MRVGPVASAAGETAEQAEAMAPNTGDALVDHGPPSEAPGCWRAVLVEVTLVTALLLIFELATNRWLVQHDVLIMPAVLVYRLYYVVVLGVLLWTFVRRSEVYLHARRTLVAMGGLALLVFWVWPVSPPRFALAGIVDIIAEHHIVGGPSSRDIGGGANLFSAMPSLHVGWSAWCAYAAWLALWGSHPRGALLAGLFPLIMVAVVFTTGSHYLLDVVGRVVLLIVAITVATAWARMP